MPISDSVTPYLDVDEQIQSFNSKCSEILGCIAPRKLVDPLKKSQPWINVDIRSLRQQCRRLERKWKKDRLQISFDMLNVSIQNFQKAVRTAKHTFVSIYYCKKLSLF